MSSTEVSSKEEPTELKVASGEPEEWKRFDRYDLKVDPDQGDRASEVKFFSVKRPHMAAFHMVWWAFFNAFVEWFAIAPLIPEIRKTLNMSKADAWTSNICNVGGAVLSRIIVGPLCDVYGPRKSMAIVLILGSIPVGLVGLVKTKEELYALRFFIGMIGSTFVTSQYWTTAMFTKEIVGSVNAFTAGWGNLGGGITQLFVGSFLFPIFRDGLLPDNYTKAQLQNASELSWRIVCCIPAFIGLTTGILCWFTTDDCPKGNYSDLKKHGSLHTESAASSLRKGVFNINTWILFILYACSFGVELVKFSGASEYFNSEFGLTTEKAAAIASIFGFFNFFSRFLGGYLSDVANGYAGMRGRLILHSLLQIAQGALIVAFPFAPDLNSAIIIMAIASLFFQASNGSCFGIVPYVDKTIGGVKGIVGAGGNVGAVLFGYGFRQTSYHNAYIIMGACVLGSAVLPFLIKIKGHRSILFGEDSEEVKAAWQSKGIGKKKRQEDSLEVPALEKL